MARKCFFAFGPSITKSQTLPILIKLIKHIAGLLSGVMPVRGLDKQLWKSTNPPCLLINQCFNKPSHATRTCQVTDLKGIRTYIRGTSSTGLVLFLTLCTVCFDKKRITQAHSAPLSPLSSTLYPFFVGKVCQFAFIDALVFHGPGFIVYPERLQEAENLLENEDIKFKLVIVMLLQPSLWVELIP